MITIDKWFTIAGVIIITASGFSAVVEGGLLLIRTGWIFWSIILCSLSRLVFIMEPESLKKKIFRLSEHREIGKFNNDLYHSSLEQWEIGALIGPLKHLAALVIMLLDYTCIIRVLKSQAYPLLCIKKQPFRKRAASLLELYVI